MRNLHILAAYVLLVPFVPCHSAHQLPLVDSVTESTGEWETYVDRRGLLVMSHDWVPSATGGFAQARVQTTIPEGSTGPYRLSFYQSDDYANDFWRAHNDSWLGGDGFYGHRFKQVWIGDDLLWESDVADANPPQAPGQIVLDLPNEIKPGDSIDLTLKVVDKVSSWIELASDTQHISTTETAAEKPGDPAKYWTHVYWGDVSILSAGEEPTEPLAPIAKIVEENHQKNWPPPPYGDPDLDLPLEFTLDCAAPLPECGFPVRCGIPLPPGYFNPRYEVELKRPDGNRIPLHSDTGAKSTWPDGSIRWLWLEFAAHPGEEARRFRVSPTSQSEGSLRSYSNISIEPSDDDRWFRIETLQEPFERFHSQIEPYRPIGSNPFLDFLYAWRQEYSFGNGMIERVESRAILGPVGMKQYSYSSNDTTSELEIGYTQNSFEISEVPRFAQVNFRTVFESSSAHPLDEMRLVTSFIPSGSVTCRFGAGASALPAGEVRLEQTPFSIVLDASRQEWVQGDLRKEGLSNWWAISDDLETHLFVIRHATETGQAGFRVIKNATEVTVQCLVFTNEHSTRGYPYTPGEAKTFEVLYAHLPKDAPVEEFEKIAANFERPPILVNNDVTCRSGAFGYALPPGDGVAEEISKWLKTTYPDPLGSSLQWGKTPRDFGDTIYNASNSWRNGYYDLRQGFVAAYLLSGNREWADALDRAVQHYVDVDTIHSSTGHPDFVGLAHGYGENHTSMDPWNPILRMNGVLAAAHIWGNDRYYEAAMTMARKIAETGRGLGASSVRDHAGVMMSIATAYRETRNPLFKEAGEKLIEDIKTNRVDQRRGTYPEVHGNWNYRGNVPWMTAQLMEPLYLFYRETGNLDAAKLVVGFAESILCENQTRGVPGDIHGYSHNPHFTKNSGYHVLIAPCLFYAYELTGDEEFKEAAVAAWNMIVEDRSFNDVQNCFWNTPTLVYYLRKFAEEGN